MQRATQVSTPLPVLLKFVLFWQERQEERMATVRHMHSLKNAYSKNGVHTHMEAHYLLTAGAVDQPSN